MPILDSGAYPAVRAALDVNLDASALPDATIALSIYAGAADLEIKRRDPDWATRVGDAAAHLQNAAVFLTAAQLAFAVPAIEREAFPDYSYRALLVDPAAKAADLRARAAAELARARGDQAATGMPLFFTVARGTRVSGGR